MMVSRFGVCSPPDNYKVVIFSILNNFYEKKEDEYSLSILKKKVVRTVLL